MCIVCLTTEVWPRDPLSVANKSLCSLKSLSSSCFWLGDDADPPRSISAGIAGEYVAGKGDSTSNSSDTGVNCPKVAPW